MINNKELDKLKERYQAVLDRIEQLNEVAFGMEREIVRLREEDSTK